MSGVVAGPGPELGPELFFEMRGAGSIPGPSSVFFFFVPVTGTATLFEVWIEREIIMKGLMSKRYPRQIELRT